MVASSAIILSLGLYAFIVTAALAWTTLECCARAVKIVISPLRLCVSLFVRCVRRKSSHTHDENLNVPLNE